MRWAVAVVVVSLAAVVAVNVLLLRSSGDRHDPVGRLSPVALLPAGTAKPRPLPPPAPGGTHGNGSESDD